MGKRVGVVLLWLTIAANVRADAPGALTIGWAGACPRPFGLEAEVAQLLGARRAQLPPTAIEVQIEELEGGFALTLEVDRGTSTAERAMKLASCREAQDAAVLLIATAIDPDAALRVPKREAPPPVAPVAPKKPKPPPYRWSLMLRGLFDLQSLPGPTLGPTLGGLWQDAHWRAWLDLRYLPGRTARAQRADVEARVDLFAAGLGGAWVWAAGPLVFGPALEVELGALRARDVRGQVRARNDASPWGSAQLGGLVAYAATRSIGVELGVFAGVPLWRPELSAGGVGDFYRTAPATMRLALGLRVSLGSP